VTFYAARACKQERKRGVQARKGTAMKPEIMIVFGIFLTFALLEALFTSLHKKPNQTRADVIVESVSTIATLGLIQPFIVFMSATLLGWAIPLYQGSLADLGFLAGFALFLIFDDLAVYCWHRLVARRLR
jgi:sterol desaturase/sphingolipid hydroxylase (fatty acid hydroxylase superfamily)